MSRLLTISLLFLLFGCGQTSDRQWKTIEIGDYLFDFPSDFKLVEEKGIDSYVGKIQGDSMWFGFDFGYYSNDFELTQQEYLDKGDWRLHLGLRFIKPDKYGDKYGIRSGSVVPTPEVEVLSIRPATPQDSSIGKGCDYIAKCKHDTVEFNFAVYIPDDIKQQNFKIDTVDGQFRKIVYSKDPKKGTTGIYIKDIRVIEQSLRADLALSMATSNLTQQQQEIALKIFETGRHRIQIK
jgi:hypothetical protein